MSWSSQASPAPDRVSAWGPTLVGELVHVAIQRIACDPVDGSLCVDGYAQRVVPASLSTAHGLMLRTRVSQALHTWLAEFDPRPRWRLVGVEVQISDVRVDLLWESNEGIWAEELKTGGRAQDARRQARAINAAGCQIYPETWRGTTISFLDPARARSELLAADP